MRLLRFCAGSGQSEQRFDLAEGILKVHTAVLGAGFEWDSHVAGQPAPLLRPFVPVRQEAKQILETSDDCIERIGEAVRYEYTAPFRHLFKRKTGLNAGGYRRLLGHLWFKRYR